jgi:hypothetical protein
MLRTHLGQSIIDMLLLLLLLLLLQAPSKAV